MAEAAAKMPAAMLVALRGLLILLLSALVALPMSPSRGIQNRSVQHKCLLRRAVCSGDTTSQTAAAPLRMPCWRLNLASRARLGWPTGHIACGFLRRQLLRPAITLLPAVLALTLQQLPRICSTLLRMAHEVAAHRAA